MAEYETYKGSYVVNAALLQRAKTTCRILHPLPRLDEIHTDVDNDPRAAYFRQMENGMYMRMAVLHWLIRGDFLGSSDSASTFTPTTATTTHR